MQAPGLLTNHSFLCLKNFLNELENRHVCLSLFSDSEQRVREVMLFSASVTKINTMNDDVFLCSLERICYCIPCERSALLYITLSNILKLLQALSCPFSVL